MNWLGRLFGKTDLRPVRKQQEVNASGSGVSHSHCESVEDRLRAASFILDKAIRANSTDDLPGLRKATMGLAEILRSEFVSQRNEAARIFSVVSRDARGSPTITSCLQVAVPSLLKSLEDEKEQTVYLAADALSFLAPDERTSDSIIQAIKRAPGILGFGGMLGCFLRIGEPMRVALAQLLKLIDENIAQAKSGGLMLSATPSPIIGLLQYDRNQCLKALYSLRFDLAKILDRYAPQKTNAK